MSIAKKYIYCTVVGVIILLISLLIAEYKRYKKIETEWKNAVENCKTYSSMFDESAKNNRALKLTVDQLEYYNDSIIKQLDDTRKSLKVKDSQLKSMQYIESSFSKSDTIILKDTLFRDPQINIDTLLSDEWYSVRLGLKYPSIVAVAPQFKSVKHIIVSSKKETVNPPKKFFLFRWFQKKHYVLNIDVIEKNPYIENNNNRYIEIVN